MSAVLGPLFLGLVVSIPLMLYSSFHHVEEGHVGVYWRGGALQKKITEPGFNFKFPYIDRFANIQVTMQTDSVINIPCGTSGGVTVYFEKIEVVNRLKKEYVYSTILNYGENYDKLWIYESKRSFIATNLV
jgi:regulator of protease activity HflC (stomatin/prohibitin superfamily)